MTEWMLLALAALNLTVLIFIGLRLRRRNDDNTQTQALLTTLRDAARADSDRLERELRDELGRNAQMARSDLGNFQQMLLNQSGDVARTQNEQIDSFRAQLGSMQQLIADQLRVLGEANANRLAEVRGTVQTQLAALQEGNERKLEQMRATVDEKLHATLEQRLGESFKQVAERLEQVHKGLGEMQSLARDVGSLNRVLTNVKTRGMFGEVQLAGLLEQVFTPEQYGANVETVPGSKCYVDFAIRLPGRRDDGAPLWLPIDAKFPREDYERLLTAQDQADKAGVEAAGKAIESKLREEARSIREKYIAAPHTTDFGILFVPTEGLYAEALRRPGLVEALQREHRITLAGPTTLLATLSSLQMGFRTLALEKRSAEVWEVLGAVKSEFQKFGDVLAKTKKKLDEASNQIEFAERRTRVMATRLKTVETLPEGRAQALLGALAEEDTGAEGEA
ncbi:MAG TPA: DNA recombination protein RmuC [Ideonella sp.]|uniref:DNA recombination protein RmuC n=1 Tax=Ideonella sp. TaxID=1929293 RepID=UPI002E34ACFA|nr:DNA recombination protein RmuC [Ideonella sp.]HEX5683171.1 DNA recombination protein RmuC [Ideonella sp.]